ncbi:unnamed protein product [Mytilus edulis]|uniref:Fibronectin type-III domain-containing protein n=1 Tax=Mytilus edulis TaxID=6550 RepID=A0A8S3RTQ5_MYTED|nr:unnamed protein product [Mytilus edulis]
MNFLRQGTQYAASWFRWPKNNDNDTATGPIKDVILEENNKKPPEASADIKKTPQKSQKLRDDSNTPALEQANKFKNTIQKDVGTDAEDETSSDAIDVKTICSEFESSQNDGRKIANVVRTTQDTRNAKSLGRKEKSCIPDKLNLIKASSSEITLRWDAPPAEYKISYYEIRYRESTEQTSRWNIFETDDNRTTATIIDLKAGAEFEVKVRAVDINGEEGPYHPSIKVATIESLANKVRMRATLHSDGCPSVYLLPMKHEKMFDNKTAKARKFVLGKTNVSCVPEKTVLIIGASKSGKSLTIDGMVNYILGVSWNEDYRFSLAQELSGENITDTDDKKVAENMLILATFRDGEEPQVTEALNAAHVPYKDVFKFMICSYALDFLTEVKRVIYKMADYNLGKETVPESFYTSLTSSFARICQLTPVPGLLYKTKLQIDTVEVTSIPDLVLEKKKNITSASSVVSIIEVKKAVITKAEENKEDKDDKKSKADIQHWLSEKVLGQHGGELLLAWNSVETEYVPGMIAVGTKIYFTLLHISLNHVRTLGPGVADMKEVDKHRATIYYSESKDILVKDDRNSLIQSIMRLNN